MEAQSRGHLWEASDLAVPPHPSLGFSVTPRLLPALPLSVAPPLACVVCSDMTCWGQSFCLLSQAEAPGAAVWSAVELLPTGSVPALFFGRALGGAAGSTGVEHAALWVNSVLPLRKQISSFPIKMRFSSRYLVMENDTSADFGLLCVLNQALPLLWLQ